MTIALGPGSVWGAKTWESASLLEVFRGFLAERSDDTREASLSVRIEALRTPCPKRRVS